MLFNNLIASGGRRGCRQSGRHGVSSILHNMTGALETTNTSTDIAIGGKGFFLVSPENSSTTYYTRAGTFRFDTEGYLRDPRGNILQGYKMPASSMLNPDQALPKPSAAILEDIRLSTREGAGVVSEPEATTELRMALNLASNAEDRSANAQSPFTALFDSWDAGRPEPLSSQQSSYSSALKIYDVNGTAHTLTAYFDPVTGITDNTSGHRVWEYLFTIRRKRTPLASTPKGYSHGGTLTFLPRESWST